VIIFLDEAALVWLGSTQNHFNVKRKLVSGFNLIWVVQSLGAKIFRFKMFSIDGYFCVVPARQRGVSRSSRTLDRNAMDATAAR
jgi:hypothetical protein